MHSKFIITVLVPASCQKCVGLLRWDSTWHSRHRRAKAAITKQENSALTPDGKLQKTDSDRLRGFLKRFWRRILFLMKSAIPAGILGEGSPDTEMRGQSKQISKDTDDDDGQQ